MPVTKLELERFGPFARAEFPLSDGVNVVLGANSTGKTFAGKALYSVLKGLGPEAAPGTAPRELQRPPPGKLRAVVERLEGEMEGKIRLEGPRFYLHLDRGGRLEAQLVAEGLRKVASIVHLVLTVRSARAESSSGMSRGEPAPEVGRRRRRSGTGSMRSD